MSICSKKSVGNLSVSKKAKGDMILKDDRNILRKKLKEDGDQEIETLLMKHKKKPDMSILQQDLRKIVLRLKGKARPSSILTVSDQNATKKPLPLFTPQHSQQHTSLNHITPSSYFKSNPKPFFPNQESGQKSDLLDQKTKNNQNRAVQQPQPHHQFICESNLFDQKIKKSDNGGVQYRCESDLFDQQVRNNKNGFVQSHPQSNPIIDGKIKNTFEVKGFTVNEAKINVKYNNNETINCVTTKNSSNEISNFKGNNWTGVSNPRKPVEELLGLELSSDDDRILLEGEKRREEERGIREEDEDEEGVGMEEEGEGEEEEQQEEKEEVRREIETKGRDAEKNKLKENEIKLFESNEKNIENLVSFAQSINSEQLTNTLSLNRNLYSNEKPYDSQNERRSPQINGNSPIARKNYHLEKSNKNSDSSSKKFEYYERNIENLVSFAHSANSEKAKDVLNQNSNEKRKIAIEENLDKETNHDYIPVTFYNKNPINYEKEDNNNNNRPYFSEEIKKMSQHSFEKNMFTPFENIETKPLFEYQSFNYKKNINESNPEKAVSNMNYTIKISGLISKKSSNASFKMPACTNNVDSPYKKNERTSKNDYYNNESLKHSPFSANSQNEEERSSYLSPKFEEKDKHNESSENKEYDDEQNEQENEIYKQNNYDSNNQVFQEEYRNYENDQNSEENHENEENYQDYQGEEEDEQHEEEEENREFNSKYISDYYKINKSYSKLSHPSKSPKDLAFSNEKNKVDSEEINKNYYEKSYLLSHKINASKDKIAISDNYINQYNYNSNNNGPVCGEEFLKPIEFNITENNEPILPSVCYKSIDCEKGRSFADYLLNTEKIEKLQSMESSSAEKLEDSKKVEIESNYIDRSRNVEIYQKTFDFKSELPERIEVNHNLRIIDFKSELPEHKAKPFDLIEGERDKYIDDIMAKYNNDDLKKPQTLICRSQLIPKFEYEIIRKFQFDGMLDCLSPEMIVDYMYFELDLNKISKTYFKMKMDNLVKKEFNKNLENSSVFKDLFDLIDLKKDEYLDVNEIGFSLEVICLRRDFYNPVRRLFDIFDRFFKNYLNLEEVIDYLTSDPKFSLNSNRLIEAFSNLFMGIDTEYEGNLTYWEAYQNKNSNSFQEILHLIHLN